ncbi:MAG TPA: hypothetical protein VFM45_09170 [Anaeromyxobacteraceae bacterium]|nr:hypothetical protein [Anaeromyxobacteraceae bacterium]
MQRVVRWLRSPRLALAVIGFLGAWTGVGAWAPWMRAEAPPPPPAWAVAVGLDHPFTAVPFLAAVALLFASTLACTWGKRARILAIRRGDLPPSALRLAPGPGDAAAFLAGEGFRGTGEIRTRYGFALWGGWVLHVGLLLLMAAVLVQYGLYDSGTFDLSEGERASLSAHGTVFGRERGPLAPEALPAVEVALARFDPFVAQHGYSRDRLSELDVFLPGEPVRTETIDRAAGIRAGNLEIFQAIPTGLALTVEMPGIGARTVKLREENPRRAVAEVIDPAGMPVRFVVDAEKDIGAPGGHGRLLVWVESRGGRQALAPGAPFPFGTGTARVVAVGRWARFTYTRTPGLSGVIAGFAAVLAGCVLLAFPAGVARLGRPGEAWAARVFAVRGGAAIAADWERAGPAV